MKLRHFFLAAFFGLVALCIYSGLKTASYYSRFPGDKGAAYETWETQNDAFKVKISAHHEMGIFMPGAFFVFESAPINSNDWRTFLEYRGDDPIPISRERFHFVNDRTAYFYGYENFVATIDAGQNWSQWKPNLPDSRGRIYQWGIKEAKIDADGKGKMTLERYDEQANKRISTEVFTENYGQNWNQLRP